MDEGACVCVYVCVCVRMLCAYACVYLWTSVRTCKKQSVLFQGISCVLYALSMVYVTPVIRVSNVCNACDVSAACTACNVCN